MFKFIAIALIAAGCLGVGLFSRNQADMRFFNSEPRSFDATVLDELPTMDNITLDQAESADFAVIAHVEQVSCRTCVDRELAALQQLSHSLQGKLDSLLVASDAGFTENGKVSKDLVDLRRVGRLSFPVLLENVRGEAGLGPLFNLSLWDRNRGEIVFRYYPQTSRDDLWPVFEKKVKTYIRAAAR